VHGGEESLRLVYGMLKKKTDLLKAVEEITLTARFGYRSKADDNNKNCFSNNVIVENDLTLKSYHNISPEYIQHRSENHPIIS